ncbi:MAG: hypothetical protein A2X86_17200 [Bdellovibrionales bacterium GWA2_49_15]|nr:MAG: hypothetical protein A2X86_17200 [Bdellovibrionales bacterium GWA2_49_15]HAZ14024.1 class I SAM-dependent methyltransferase [Bdellovibrionales bacterium]
MKKYEITEQQVTEYWNQNSSVWSEQVEKGWDYYREYLNNPAFFNLIGDVKDKIILDAGCGEGHNTRILAKKGAKVTGVDISPGMIQKAQEMEREGPLGIAYEIATFSDLKIFKNCSFDSIVSSMALMDAPHYDLALKEFYRVLKIKGSLLFSIAHPCFMTKGYSWIRDENGEESGIVASEYFREKDWIESWKFSKAPIPEDTIPFNVPCFPRTLSEYVNLLIKNGFMLARIEEPRPSAEVCEKFPWMKKWHEHAALFMHIHAVKE